MTSSAFIFALTTVVILWILYRYKPYSGTVPGRVAWLPKYRIKIRLPQSVFNARKPWLILDEKLESLGFKRINQEYFPIVYRSAHLLGDFSTKWLGLNLTFHELPSGCYDCPVTLEASWLVLFDTGDMWKLLQAVKEKIEQDNPRIWLEGTVNTEQPHIRLTAQETGKVLARVAPDDDHFAVEFMDAGTTALMNVVEDQLDLYLNSHNEPDPWQYALYHCSTAANVYSPVTWSHQEAKSSRVAHNMPYS